MAATGVSPGAQIALVIPVMVFEFGTFPFEI